MIARLPVNARSECVAPSTFPFGGVVESMRMFHAACAASQRPGLRPTRGSGVGAVSDTIGVTGAGITAGGGGGGGGGVPRPAGAAAGGRVLGVAAALPELAHALAPNPPAAERTATNRLVARAAQR